MSNFIAKYNYKDRRIFFRFLLEILVKCNGPWVSSKSTSHFTKFTRVALTIAEHKHLFLKNNKCDTLLV